MGEDHRRRELPDGVSRLIKFKARQLVGHYGFNQTDGDDIEQDLATDLLSRLDRFNPARGKLKPYVDHLIKKCIATLIEYKLAAKRDYRREQCSLDAPVRDADGNETQLGALMDENDGARRLGRQNMHFTDRAALAEIRSRLPEGLRQLWDELKSVSQAEAARRLGIPRSTLYEQKKLLKQLCEDAGLRKYLDE